jgi:hypothetical protein
MSGVTVPLNETLDRQCYVTAAMDMDNFVGELT